jgi:hypothetical protein
MKHIIPRIDYHQLAQLVTDLVAGRVFTSGQVSRVDELPLVFMTLSLGAYKDWPKEELNQIGLIYEYLDKAMPRSINGMPTFFSHRVVHALDVPILNERYAKAREALRIAAEG